MLGRKGVHSEVLEVYAQESPWLTRLTMFKNLYDLTKLFFLLFTTCWIIILSYSFNAKAQKKKATNKKSFWANIDSLRTARIEVGKSLFTPFVAPSYSPELEFLLSAGGLYTFKIEKENPFLERSSLPFSVGLSSNGSIQISAKLTLYGKGDRNRGIGEFWLKDMPDNYWGVGYNNGRNRDISDSTTAYQRKWRKLYYKHVRRLGAHMFAGVILDVNRTMASELNPLMKEDPSIIEFGTNISNSGLGIAVQYDSRDLIVNAYKGLFLDFSLIYYDKFLGGKHQFTSLEIDYRQYANLGRERSTLAWQIKTRNTFGDTPWTDLSQLGTPFDLRGYRWGRFRDKATLLGLVEYRHMFNRRRPNKKGSLQSRSGFVGWVGTGTLGDNISEYKRWIPNYGVGFRFETQKRMNVRIDYGFGIDSSAIYVTFNEAY